MQTDFKDPYKKFLKAMDEGASKIREKALEANARHLYQADKNLEELLLDEDPKVKMDATKFVYKINGLDVDRSEVKGDVVINITPEHAMKVREARKLTK